MVLTSIKKRAPKEKLTIGEIIKNKGYYDICGNWNSIMTFAQYPNMLFRGRVEVFIFDHNDIFAYINPNTGRYRIPGGSIDKNNTLVKQVVNEAKEEARINVGKIEYTGYSYIYFFKKKYDKCPIHWDGVYNKVYIAQFKSWYYGNINPNVSDYYMSKYGNFFTLEYLANFLSVDHMKALNLIPKNKS